MISMLLSVAWATIDPVSQVAPRYPVRAVYDSSVEVRCAGTAVLDAKGRPAEVDIDGCEPAFEARAAKAFGKWRWPRDHEGEVVSAELVFVPPVDALSVADPLTWRRRWYGSCQALIAVRPDGTPRIRSADDGCAPVLAPVSPTPAGVIRKRAPELCTVSFQAEDGEARHIESFRCDMRLQRYARDAISAWSWGGDGVVPYTVLLQLDGDGR